MKKHKIWFNFSLLVFSTTLLALALIFSTTNLVKAQIITTSSPTTTTTSSSLTFVQELYDQVRNTLGSDTNTIVLLTVAGLSTGLSPDRIQRDGYTFIQKRSLNPSIKGGKVVIVDSSGKEVFDVTDYFNKSHAGLITGSPLNPLDRIRAIARNLSETGQGKDVIIKEIY